MKNKGAGKLNGANMLAVRAVCTVKVLAGRQLPAAADSVAACGRAVYAHADITIALLWSLYT